MSRAIVLACVPWAAVLAASLLVAWGLLRMSNARLQPRRLRLLHGDQAGSVQSLSFVLTLPLFVMVMMLIVQVSQLMIGIVVVHYAAYAAARSAVVWIPAALPSPEGPNCISAYGPDPTATDQVIPVLDPQQSGYGPGQGGVTYLVQPGSLKYAKITSAAVLACAPISPSRDLGYGADAGGAGAVLKAAYADMAPGSRSNAAVPRRLDNKLAYALNNTSVEIRFFHKNLEPPLVTYFEPPDPGEFYFNEIGWQDPVTVKVKYNLALLPGPGRLLARYVAGPSGQADKVSEGINNRGAFYSYPLSASITMCNEGEKSVIPYVYQAN